MLHREIFYAGLILALSLTMIAMVIGVMSVADSLAVFVFAAVSFVGSVIFFEE